MAWKGGLAMTTKQTPKICRWLSEPLPQDVANSIARLAEADDVRHLAIMPDIHLAKEVCVGVALATKSLIYPAAVGSDIGCGMIAVRFDCPADLLADERTAARILAGLYGRVPAMRHPRATMPLVLPQVLQELPLSHPKLEKLKSRDGRVQLGTLGRGNHFLEFQQDAEGSLWLMIHSGSRGMGQAITTHHMELGKARQRNGQLLALSAGSPEGAAYLADVSWAEQYANHNRLTMMAAVADLLDALFNASIDHASLIHANHNHVRRENHFGEEVWVHRKGALSAQSEESGIIPGSMGTASFHVTGRGCEEALCSSSHGAGRAMGRTEAMKSIGSKQLLREMDGVWFDHRQANRLRDEAPSAYKDIHHVMRAQRELTRIVRELQPVLNYKAS
jgi:tRNA-splicing ligase RtcB (3'-phosphate/5'-hydroxy nucleic acid ligase)